MKHFIFFFVVTSAVIYKTTFAYSPSYSPCAAYKCNATDPNCDVIGKRCKKDYRMCCDHVCRRKQEECPSTGRKKHAHGNYSRLSSSLNATDLARQFEEIKKHILAYYAENDCWPEDLCINSTTCKPQYQQCESGQCTILLSGCNNWWESTNYLTDNKSNVTCYPKELCFRNQCKASYWMCNNGECVHEQVLCRGGFDCSDGSDEAVCSGECYPPFRCYNNTCKFGFFSCGNGECILSEKVCDTVSDCFDGSDEKSCSAKCHPRVACEGEQCKPGYFRCDKTKCIPDTNLCDQRANCDDGTDEVRDGHGFKCVLGRNFDTCLLPQAMVYESSTKCIDHADKCIGNNANNCFTCLDKRLVISKKQQCDGVFDCYDLSDECLCHNSTAEKACKSLCLGINSNATSISHWPQEVFQYIPTRCNCSIGRFDCGNGICINKNQICDGVADCGSSSADESHCDSANLKRVATIFCPGDVSNSTLIEAVLCDGRPECHDLSDECNDRCNSTFCNIKKMFNSKQGPYEFLCNKRFIKYFDVRSICDGKWTSCYPRIEEEETNCPARFYCKSGNAISIDKNLICDGIPQCDDKSDEQGCSDRFYCENEIPYSIPLSSKLDGKRDCSDFSDECPKELDDNVLSSRKELLGSAEFRAATWIIGILATVGNIVTFIGACRSLRNEKNFNVSPISTISCIFLLNLSAADGLMGIYLLILAIKSAEFSGNYCMVDKLWRTSSTCAGIGGLALTSSQTSVIMLVSLTTLRLYSVKYPMKTQSLSWKIPIVAMSCAWFLSILIAILPRTDCFSNYFISEIWMPTSFTNIEYRGKTADILFIHRLAAIQPASEAAPLTTTWNDMHVFLERYYPNIHVKGYFGYFSDNSVCLPKFFVSVGEAGWEYSILIISINFLSFIYICIAYWKIFRASSAGYVNKLRSKQIEKLQSRVARLVVTDFLCWIPICIMSFVQFGGVIIPGSAYAFSAVILLPINSAINPFLYSNTIAEPLERMFRSAFRSARFSELSSCAIPSRKKQTENVNRSSNEGMAYIPTVITEEKVI